jgi:vesicle-associated membrane protein 7
LERGEKIELLVDKTENLNAQAVKFKKSSTQLKQAMWWKNAKLMAVLAIIVLVRRHHAALTEKVLIFIILLSVCGGFSFPKCH